MARLVRGCPTTRQQQEGAEEPEWEPQQEDQPDATNHKEIADYDPDIDYEGTDLEVEPVAQEEREVNPDKEYANMDTPHDVTLCQRIRHLENCKGTLWVHRAGGPEIMALKLQSMYTQLGFSPKAAKLLLREQWLNRPDRLRVLADKNANDICYVMRKPGGKNANGTPREDSKSQW